MSTFKPLNAVYSKFERLKMSRSTFLCDRKRGCQIGGSLSFGFSKIQFGILDSVLAIRNNSGIANYSEMPIPNYIFEK